MLFIYILNSHQSSVVKALLSSFVYDKAGTERLRDLPKAPSSEWQGRVSACAPATTLAASGFDKPSSDCTLELFVSCELNQHSAGVFLFVYDENRICRTNF